MALQTEAYKAKLKLAWQNARNSDAGEDAALDAFVSALATATEEFVKSARVKYTNGLTAPNGAVTGTFNHTIE